MRVKDYLSPLYVFGESAHSVDVSHDQQELLTNVKLDEASALIELVNGLITQLWWFYDNATPRQQVEFYERINK